MQKREISMKIINYLLEESMRRRSGREEAKRDFPFFFG